MAILRSISEASEWLNTFAYRTAITAFPFVTVVGISILLVLVAGGYSAWKSGTMNPGEVIKSE